MSPVSDIKLIRTDTTLDLSQKAEKGMPSYTIAPLFIQLRPALLLLLVPRLVGADAALGC